MSVIDSRDIDNCDQVIDMGAERTPRPQGRAAVRESPRTRANLQANFLLIRERAELSEPSVLIVINILSKLEIEPVHNNRNNHPGIFSLCRRMNMRDARARAFFPARARRLMRINFHLARIEGIDGQLRSPERYWRLLAESCLHIMPICLLIKCATPSHPSSKMLFPPGGKKATLTIFALINMQSAIFTRAGRSRVSSKRSHTRTRGFSSSSYQRCGATFLPFR